MREQIDDVSRAAVFEERLATLDPRVQGIVQFLRVAATHAGEGVPPPTFEVRGVGLTYWAAGKPFVRIDPKKSHVWVHFKDGQRQALGQIGKVADRTDGVWLTIQQMMQAVRLVPLILQAHDAAVEAGTTRRKVTMMRAGDK